MKLIHFKFVFHFKSALIGVDFDVVGVGVGVSVVGAADIVVGVDAADTVVVAVVIGDVSVIDADKQNYFHSIFNFLQKIIKQEPETSWQTKGLV